MSKREQLAPRRRLASEDVLGDREVDDDDDRIGEGEDVCRPNRGKAPDVPGDEEEGDEEERLLPRGDDVQRRPADAEVPQLGHDGVVEDEPDDEHGDRDTDDATRANRRPPPASARG